MNITVNTLAKFIEFIVFIINRSLKSSSNVRPLVCLISFAPSLKQQDNTAYKSLVFLQPLTVVNLHRHTLPETVSRRRPGGTPPRAWWRLINLCRHWWTPRTAAGGWGGAAAAAAAASPPVSSSGRGLGNNSALLPDAAWLVGNVTQTNSVRFLCLHTHAHTHTSVWASFIHSGSGDV